MNYYSWDDTEADVKFSYPTILCTTLYSLNREIATVTSLTIQANENGFVSLSQLLFII
jgi:hypothetical protein